MTRQEIKEKTIAVATRCYYHILAEENKKLSKTGGKCGLTTLERLDLYQRYRDKACNKYCPEEMFWLDYFDLFDQTFEEVKAEKEWESLVLF